MGPLGWRSQTMILLLVAVTCFFCLHDQMFVGATEMTMKESTAIYNTSIEYDPLTADVITYVPYHHRDGMEFREHTKIENVYRGISVWREAGDDYCYHRTLMEYERPLTLSRIVESVAANNLVVDAKKMTQVLVWARPMGEEMSTEERGELTKDMEQLCAGARIVKMSTRRVSREQFDQLVEETGECYTSQSGLNRGRRSPKPQIHYICNTYSGGGGSGGGGGWDLRRKRSVDDRDYLGMGSLIHLIIGHRQINCQ